MEAHNMIRFRISFLSLLVFATIKAEDAARDLQKVDGLMNTLVKLLKKPAGDLTASASEVRVSRGLHHSGPFRGTNCYDCNSEPWIPIVGRSLNFHSTSHSHTNSIGPYFKEKFAHNQLPVDQYGAPQASFNFPAAGEVVDFMLPPPFKISSFEGGLSSFHEMPSLNYGPPKPPVPQYGPPRLEYRPPKPQYGLPKSEHGPPNPQYDISRPDYGPPKLQYNPPTFSSIINLSPPPLRTPGGVSSYHSLPADGLTTHLRPVADFGLPLGGPLPLENNLPPAQPSDSYGRPLGPSDSYGSSSMKTHLEPIFLSSDNYGNHMSLRGGGFESQYSSKIKSGLYQKGLTDVQVVPSVQIADYTASIEHPINLIQSPILDLSIKDHLNSPVEEGINKVKLSEKPIVVDDTFTSASDINTTYSTGIERQNDKYLSSETHQSTGQDDKLTGNPIKKLLLKHNIIEDPSTRAVEIEKSVINLNQVGLNLAEPSWSPPRTTWLTPVNETFPAAPKHPKELRIIVPYLKAPLPPSTAIYNWEYTTLAPVFVPPPVSTESSSLWTQLVDEIRTGETQKDSAHGFQKSTTEVYNINDYLRRQKYDGKVLQKNIDDWTHQSYSDRHLGKISKLVHAKVIPGEYFTTSTTPLRDHLASGSDHQDVISNEIEENVILPEVSSQKPPPSSTFAAVHFLKKPSKLYWEENKVTLRNSTHEKVYLVTPQSYVGFMTSTESPATAFSMAPKVQNGKVNNVTSMTRIRVRMEPSSGEEDSTKLKPVKVIYSEWPHLINDLETTTTPKPTSRHPLFGLMDMAAYTDGPNTTVQTLSGHSKVVSVGTSPQMRITSTTPLPKVDLNATVKVLPVAV